MIAACILLIAALAAAISYLAFRRAFYVSPRQRGKKFALPGGWQYEKVKDRTRALVAEMEALPYEQIFITARDGTRLAGRYYHLQNGAPLQIQFHGYRGSSTRDFCGGHRLARESGHNTLVVDQRAHGASEGSVIAFGVLERHDCQCWANYAARRFGSETPIFLSGVSMGAATVLMASALDLPENVRGVIADCPYSSPAAIIRKVCGDMKLPPALAFPFVRLGGRLFGGFDICAASPVQAIGHSRIPALILHGEDDRFVPCEMAAEILAARRENTICETFPGAGHGLSYIVDPERYARIVNLFIDECLSGGRRPGAERAQGR